ncbi:MAG: AAA family ATPase [Deltaproteobacteria bacterium]|nr:AAA family ATPase [Deltaproteobacteria bacterium]
MKFYEVVEQVLALLQREERVSYRALKREFGVDDDYLEDLKAELIKAKRLAVDEEGEVLVWVGDVSVVSHQSSVISPQSPTSNPQPPISYTPAHLAERIRAEQAALEARSGTDGERKTITALFADLKGSTALIEGLDPEEARAIIDPALQLMMDAVHQYDGYVAQALGDGIFALFGAPIAHEDHPQRALYAALRMQDAMRRYADTLRQKGYSPLLMRVGLNTGEVVLRSIRKDDLHADYVPVGHSTNLAARMEQLAAPGSILVTAYTHRLTDGYFAFKDLGPTQIKGVEEPINVYEVLGAGPLRTRLQVSARRGLTRFVGRHNEMEQLQQALGQTKAGHGQIVGVMGEPGLGKSRLFYEFKLLSLTGCLVLEAYSVSHGKATAYLPVIELLKSYFEIQAQDDERKRREKVIGKVLGLDRSLEDTLPYLFALLGIEEQPSPLQQMDPQIRRRRTFDALKKLFLRESLNQPLILIFEDLHWIDGETQGFLDVLSESIASAKLLLLINYRPEYRQEWGQKTYYTQLRLAPFGKAEAEEFLDELLGRAVGADRRIGPSEPGAYKGTPLQDLKHLILEKTQGTPFFMEEIVQDLFEQGVLTRVGVGADLRVGPQEGAHPSTPLRTGSGAPLHIQIPSTVQGILAARIDRLTPEEKALLQQLSVVGREFPLSLVRQVVTHPEEELYRLLSSLQRKEFLYEQPAFPEVEYSFKHALTQEVAYGTVLHERRKALHERTAQAMEALYGATLEDHYSDLAHHYTRSGNTEKAVEYLHLAGQQAVQRSANAEAITHLTTALELLTTLPDTHERTQQELTLQVTLGGPLQATRGASSPELRAAYTRARELCQQVGETRQLFPVLLGLRTFHHVRGEFLTARELGEQLLGLAQREQDPALLVQAYRAVGGTLFHLGEFGAAQAHLAQGLTLYDAQHHHFPMFLIEPGVFGLSYTAWVLWHLGYPDQALQKSAAARTLAQELSYPLSLAAARVYAAMSHQLRRERAPTQEWAEAGITLASEQGFPVWLGQGTILQGWAQAEQGQVEEGITQIRQGLATCQAVGAGIFQSYYLALLVEAYRKAGQAEDGLAALAEALAVVDKSGERFYEAELYRIKGELTLAQSKTSLKHVSGKSKTSPDKSEVTNPQSPTPNPQSEAEACFLKAIDIAQKQQAKSLELRATVSLARLWQQQATQQGSRITHHETRTRLDTARTMLSEIYNWFTEGFDTVDLQEAKALLDSLESGV